MILRLSGCDWIRSAQNQLERRIHEKSSFRLDNQQQYWKITQSQRRYGPITGRNASEQVDGIIGTRTQEQIDKIYPEGENKLVYF